MNAYTGRFAPSPSGPLHFGSLVCALASYLDSRANQGKWLVRIEDIDPPREQQGATEKILCSLIAHGLNWDEEVRFQSQQSKTYDQILLDLESKNLTYRCNCTRRRLSQFPRYDQHCIDHPPNPLDPAAVRLNVADCKKLLYKEKNISSNITFLDVIQGCITDPIEEDFIIHRKDGLFAYQLAVVADDIDQNITHIVRGSDLIDTTSKQLFLFQVLASKPPTYAHIPVIVDEKGNKLSKQNHAQAIIDSQPQKNLIDAANALNIPVEQSFLTLSVPAILEKLIQRWDINKIPKRMEVYAQQ